MSTMTDAGEVVDDQQSLYDSAARYPVVYHPRQDDPRT